MALVFLGDRTGQSMIEKLKSKVSVWLKVSSAKVAVQDEPFAVAVLTPLMSRYTYYMHH